MMWNTIIESPVGPLYALTSAAGVRALVWRASALTPMAAVPVPADHTVFARLTAQLAEYFVGARRTFDLALDPVGTEFQRLAWDALRSIPYGSTRTYSEQAAAIGRPKAVRAVGSANARNPISIVVPCHRVLGADGGLTGFAGGLAAKRLLLELESRTASTQPVARPRVCGDPAP